MVAGEPGVADHRIAVHFHQSCGGADAGSIGQVLEDRQRLLVAQLGAEQRGSLPLGEAGLASATVEHAALLVFAVAGEDGQVAGSAFPIVGAILVLTAESGQVFLHGYALPDSAA